MSTIPINGTFSRNTPAQLANSQDINGSPLQVANLAALQGYTDLDVLTVGQWGYALDTGKMYTLTTKNNGSPTPHVWTEFTSSSTISGITETLTITTNGQTSFTLANTPINIFGIILNQGSFVKYGTDFTVSGNTLTWLNPNGITIDLGDTAYFLYSYSAVAPVPVTKYLPVPLQSLLSSSTAFFPFLTSLTSTDATTQVVYTFDVPDDFTSLISFTIPGCVDTTSAGGGPYNYTFTINYASDGELPSTHTSSVIKTKDFTGIVTATLQRPMFDLTSDMSSVLAIGRKIGIGIASDRTHQVALSGAMLAYI